MIFETCFNQEIDKPDDWSICPLVDLVLVNTDNLSSKEIKDNGNELIRYLDISSVGYRTFESPLSIQLKESPSRAKRKVKFGDTIISTVRPNRKSLVFINEQLDGAIASTGFVACRPKNLADMHWIHYLLTSQIASDFYVAHSEGGAYPAFNPGLFERTSCLIPPADERRKIGFFLHSLDSLITNLAAQNIRLESIAQTLFKSWFVNFDPVHAKAAGREPEGLSKEIAALFPSEFGESELGLIPKGWCIKTVEQSTVRLKPAQVFSEDDCKDTLGVPLFDQSSKIFVGYTEAEAKVESSEFNPAFLFGDHTCVMRLNSESFNISANVIPLKASQADGYWLYYAMKGLQKFESYRRHWSELKVKTLLIPSENLMASFGSVARDVHKTIENNEKLCFVLSRIRDELLPQLISGKIRIEEAEEALADVMPSTEKQVA